MASFARPQPLKGRSTSISIALIAALNELPDRDMPNIAIGRNANNALAHWRLKPVPGLRRPIVPSKPSTAICSGLPVIAARRILVAWAQSHVKPSRRIGAGGGRAGDGSTQGTDKLAVAAWNKHAWLSGTGTAITDVGRRSQRGVWLSR
jgi:hypothetical protein